MSAEKPNRPQLVELTSKRFKAVQLAGMVLCFAGFGGFFALAAIHWLPLAFVSIGLSVVGGLVALTGSVLAWWHHG